MAWFENGTTVNIERDTSTSMGMLCATCFGAATAIMYLAIRMAVTSLNSVRTMNEPTSTILQLALYRIARGLARIVLRHGMSGKDVVHIVKKALVDVAREEYGKSGRPTNKARIAVMTGFTRAEVDRLISQPAPHLSEQGSAHPLNRLVMHWLRESPWAVKKGQPKTLSIESGPDSFVALAQETGRDAAWQTLLGELTRTGVAQIEGDRVRLVKPGFLPAQDEAVLLPFLGEDVPALIDTMNFNLQQDKLPKRFQRKVVFPALTDAGLAHLQHMAETDGQQLLEKLDEELRTHVPEFAKPGQALVGLGVYVLNYNDLESN